MRLSLVLLLLLAPAPAAAQVVVVSPGPDSTSVTVYRDPDRGAGGIDANFPTGFALVSETRRIALPAGDATIRFEGVADGMIAVSAVVTGLPGGVIQKNRDARLLSPATLLDGTLGNRVHLRRTDRATGRVTEQDAVIRSGADGAVVLQTAQGFEALRCSGLPEALSHDSVPPGLSPKPTLSVMTSSPAAAEAEVTLIYLATGFDWEANYVARVAADGRTLDLFAWLTVANGNATGFPDSRLLAVAGRLERQTDHDLLVEDAPSPRLDLACWPMATTSTDIPPPPPAAPVAEAAYDIVVTAQRRTEGLMVAPVMKMAEQEDLGDLKLYRVPMRVDVKASGQKQVALLRKAAVPFRIAYVASLDSRDATGESRPMARVLRMRNREGEGLGLPLPAGGVALFEEAGGESLMVADGHMRDHAVGEEVELEAGDSAQVRIARTVLAGKETSDRRSVRVDLSNALSRPVAIEVKIGPVDGEWSPRPSRKLVTKDGAWLWALTLPANGTASLAFSARED